MEVDKIISCNLIFKDGSKMEIKPANSMVLKRESYCSNCGKHVPLQFWIYCPYCGKEKICDIEFAFTIPEEAAKLKKWRIRMDKIVKGYKVFNSDWTCRDKQYTCPGTFEENVSLDVCYQGMHFCRKAIDCFCYYNFNPSNHVAEVIAYGNVKEIDNKCCTDKLKNRERIIVE